EGKVAAGASEHTFSLLVVQRAGEGALGIGFTQDCILLRREQLAPFIRGVRHLVNLGRGLGTPAAPSERSCAGGSKGAEDNAANGDIASRNHDDSLASCA